ncbi:SAG family member [Eimeria brunetti]|uniref:SAG family member n=1 Tax=Eimeria brunetti TaxID=51314 RepID=U6L5D4_9EIME|nr:SAG family member [Eimeria brunetti]
MELLLPRGNWTEANWAVLPLKVTRPFYACLPVNLARNGKLPVHINEVSKDEKLVSSLMNILVVSGETDSQATCQTLFEGKEQLKNVFHHVLESQDEPDYRQLLQASLNEGLEAFKNKEYPKTEGDWQKVWANEAGANLAYLLSANSTAVGCVIGKCTAVPNQPPAREQPDTETQGKTAVLFCQLDPAATKGQAPFGEEYFAGLIARTAQLADMSADDLKAPTNDGTAAAAVPTIVFAGFAAMLTAISA